VYSLPFTASCSLAGQAHGRALGHERSKRQRLGRAPVERLLLVALLAPRIEEALELRMHVEVGRRLGDAREQLL
jgi:hypothetical protein